MRLTHFAAPILALAFLSACEPTTSNMTSGQNRSAGPARTGPFAMQCQASARNYDPAAKQNLSELMNVSVDQVPQVFCTRLINGVESGQLSSADVNSMTHGNISPRLIEVLRGN